MIVIFGFVLPEVIDYQQVWETIQSLSGWRILALLAAGVVTYLPEGTLYAVLVPVLSVLRGMGSWVASTAVASTVPVMNLVTRFGMYRSYGASAEDSMLGIFLSGGRGGRRGGSSTGSQRW